MRRRICVVGAALTVGPLAFGITAMSTQAKPKSKATPTPKTTKVDCATNVSIAIPPGQTGVTPPVQQGSENGSAACGKLLGRGVQADNFTVPDSGDVVANYWMYFPTGAIHGTYDLTPQEGTFTGTNFSEVDYLGTLTVTGGTAGLQGMKGTGTMTCKSPDGIHTSCTDKLTLKGS